MLTSNREYTNSIFSIHSPTIRYYHDYFYHYDQFLYIPFCRHNIFDMQDNLGTSETHDDDDIIVVENNTESSTMPSVINPYHENERDNENAKVTMKSKQNVNAADKEISAIPLNSGVVSNLICDISNIRLGDHIVSDVIDDYKNTTIIAPAPTPKTNSKNTNASKRCKKCNCACDKSTTDRLAQNTIRTNADCQRDEADSCATENDAVRAEEPTATATS